MSTRAVVWPSLPAVEELLEDEPAWGHPGIGAGGIAHLRVWSTPSERRLAVVTEQGMGCSTTNAAENIHAALVQHHGPDVVHLEHYPPEQHLDDQHTLDQVVLDDRGKPQWRRIWPTPSINPHHDEFDRWVREGGAAVLAALTEGGVR